MGKVSANDVIKIAQGQIGETSYKIKENYTTFHKDLGQGTCAWCALFVCWCFWKACGESKKSAKKLMSTWEYGCKNMYDNASSSQKFKGKSKVPQPGDIVIMHGSEGAWHHAGIVTKVKNNKVYYVSGNGTNDAVYESSNTFGSDFFNGFIRPNYSSSTKKKESYDHKVKVKFTAYYPDDSELEGGYNDCLGKKLTPTTVNICAVPNEIIGSDRKHYNDKIKFTSKNNPAVDGKVYYMRDVGGAIVKQGDTYRIDICVKDKAAESSFKNGTGYGYYYYEEGDSDDSDDDSKEEKTKTETATFDDYQLVNIGTDGTKEYWNFQKTIEYEVVDGEI